MGLTPGGSTRMSCHVPTCEKHDMTSLAQDGVSVLGAATAGGCSEAWRLQLDRLLFETALQTLK